MIISKVKGYLKNNFYHMILIRNKTLPSAKVSMRKDFNYVTVLLFRMPYSVQDQITELSKKLALHEGDLKAYDEASKQEIQQNFEKITELRASNKTLHKKLADSVNGDCKVIENALGDRKVERQALRSKPGREAVEIIDQKVCDYIKKLNAMKV